jgi:AraC-like DNA-binding protein
LLRLFVPLINEATQEPSWEKRMLSRLSKDILGVNFGANALIHTGYEKMALRVEHSDVTFDLISSTDVAVSLNLSRTHAVDLSIDGRKSFAAPDVGTVTIVPPGARARVAIRGRAKAVLLSIPWGRICTAAMEMEIDPDRLEGMSTVHEHDAQLAQLIYALLLGNRPQNIIVDSIAKHLVHRTLTKTYRRARGGLSPVQLQRVLNYIDAHLADPLTLDLLAAKAQTSRFHFAHCFKTELGLSPYQYIIKRRVAHAIELLGEHNCTVAEVAAKAGFLHASQMAATMVRVVGVTPRILRTRILP